MAANPLNHNRELDDTKIIKVKAMMKQLTTLEWKKQLKNTKLKLKLFKPKRPNMRHYFENLNLSRGNLKLANGGTLRS